MAQLTGYSQVFARDTSVVDSNQQHSLGIRAFDPNGNEYIYLKGIGSTVVGTWVSFDEDGITIRLTGNALGRVGIAMAAIEVDRYGWYQIFGTNTVAKTDTVAADAQLYIDGTAGRADDADVPGDMIIGAFSRSADSTNVATVELNYPFVCDTAIN